MDSASKTHPDKSPGNSSELLDNLLRVSQIVRLRFNDWLSDYELNEGRHAVLVALCGEDPGGCSQAHLADRLAQSESNVSTLIERMQRDDLVTRSKSDADRRKRILRITPKGRSLLNTVDAHRVSWARKLLNGMSSTDRSLLLSLLRQLVECLGTSTTYSTLSPSQIIAKSTSSELDRIESTEDPRSPQSALRQMLQALSSSTPAVSDEKEVA